MTMIFLETKVLCLQSKIYQDKTRFITLSL